jgi:Icc-related predicted phosphoesterase
MVRPIRIATLGDLHIRTTVPSEFVIQIRGLESSADILAVAGDITNGGRIQEVELAAEFFKLIKIPIIAVLGNHDRRTTRRRHFVRILEQAGVVVLDGTTYDLNGRVGFAGVSGSGGGFWPDDFSDPVSNRAWQAMAFRARREAQRLDDALTSLSTPTKVAVLHFAPTTSTLLGEPRLKYWLLGNSVLGNVVDRHQVDLVIHGHSHLGTLEGTTLGGTPVRNVSIGVTGGLIIHELYPESHSRPNSASTFASS